MFTTSLFQRLLVSLAVMTAFGILVHDTKLDEAVVLALPVATATFGLAHAFDSGDSAHTHVERASLSHAFSGIPRVQARDDHRRYYVPKQFGRNTDYLGGSRILWPSV